MENINYEFKDMATIDVAESVSESAHVLIEDGGVIKRAAKGEVGGAGGASSWNDLKDKPFEDNSTKEMFIDSYSHTFTGNCDDYDKMQYERLWIDGENFVDSFEVNDEVVLLWNDVEYKCIVKDNDGIKEIEINDVDMATLLITLPVIEDSVFVFHLYDGHYSKDTLTATFSLYKINENIKKLDPKFLPEVTGGGIPVYDISQIAELYNYDDGEDVYDVWRIIPKDLPNGTCMIVSSVGNDIWFVGNDGYPIRDSSDKRTCALSHFSVITIRKINEYIEDFHICIDSMESGWYLIVDKKTGVCVDATCYDRTMVY